MEIIRNKQLCTLLAQLWQLKFGLVIIAICGAPKTSQVMGETTLDYSLVDLLQQLVFSGTFLSKDA